LDSIRRTKFVWNFRILNGGILGTRADAALSLGNFKSGTTKGVNTFVIETSKFFAKESFNCGITLARTVHALVEVVVTFLFGVHAITVAVVVLLTALKERKAWSGDWEASRSTTIRTTLVFRVWDQLLSRWTGSEVAFLGVFCSSTNFTVWSSDSRALGVRDLEFEFLIVALAIVIPFSDDVTVEEVDSQKCWEIDFDFVIVYGEFSLLVYSTFTVSLHEGNIIIVELESLDLSSLASPTVGEITSSSSTCY